jgi:hypothetical protein
MNKKPWLAASLNLLPGLGYLYLGTRKTFSYLLLAASALFLADYMSSEEIRQWWDSEPFTIWTYLMYTAATVAFIYDAYSEAKSKQE